MLLIAGGALLINSPRQPDTRPVVTATLATASPTIAVAASSLDEMSAATSGGAVEATGEGIALVDTHTLTTTMAFVSGSIIRATTERGHVMTAERVATDPVTGVTVATFAHPVTATTAPTAPPARGEELTSLEIPDDGHSDMRSWQQAPLTAAAALQEVDASTIGTLEDANKLAATPTSVLVDASDAVVGVADPAIGADAYLPAPMAAKLSALLLDHTTLSHGRLGITGADDHGVGAKVVTVEQNGPVAGILQAGDIISAVDATNVTCAADLVDAVWTRPAGQKVALTFTRHGATLHATVTLAAAP